MQKLTRSFHLQGRRSGSRLLLLAALAGFGACSSSNGTPGTGGAPGTGGSRGTGGATGSGGASSSGGAPGGGGTVGTGGGTATGGTVGSGGAAGGAGAGGSVGTGGAAGAAGGGVAGAPGGTATRPLLTAAQAANYTIARYLANTGSVAAPTTTDPWDPTAGVGDVSTFVPTYTVAATGGTHPTVQAAITAAVTAGGTARIYIRVMPAIYRELVCVLAGAPPITLYSTNADATQTVIVFNNAAGTLVGGAMNPCIAAGATTIGTDGSATFAAYAANFHAKNITIANDVDETPFTTAAGGNGQTQGVALHSRGDKSIYENVRLLGNQDTLLVKNGNATTITRSYFKSCTIEGDVDFLCGRGTAVFDGCTLHFLTRANGGQFVAPSTAAANPYGFLIIGSMLTADAGATNLRLGRAWDEGVATGAYVAGMSPNGQVVIRDSVLSAGVPTVSTMTWNSSTSTRPFSATGNRMYEYNNTGPGAVVP
jgi:pectinesterase